MIILERNGEHVRLEVYANGGARCTVAAFELIPNGAPRPLQTDSINLNRAPERAKWAEALPAHLRAEAEAIGMALGVEVDRARAQAEQARRPGRSDAMLAPAEPWPDPVSSAALLDELVGLCARYLVLPAHGAAVLALWLAHTYVADVADYTPYIHLSSPVRGCGKSTVLQLLEALAFRARRTDSITAAALYRTIEEFSPSLLLDELDTQIKERSESSEHLRGILNSGFQRGGRRTLCVGDENETRDFRTYCPKVLAGIGRLWDTVASRSIRLPMQKASRAELRGIEKIRGDRIGSICEPTRRRLLRWANDARAELADADPEVPEALEARQADVWRALLAIADLAGADWARHARAAAESLAGATQHESDYKLLLLEDLRALFSSSRATGDGKLLTAWILEELHKREDRPWPEYRRDKPISATQIAGLLREFDIAPKGLRIPGEKPSLKGYSYADCLPAFTRYLPAIHDSAATSATKAPATERVADVAAESDGLLRDTEQYELDERAGMADA